VIPERQVPEPGSALAVGDPARPALRRAILGTLLAAAVFSVFTGPVKQVSVLYDHAPWLDDPYDTAVSFAMFFVPLFAACCLVRVPLCRRSEPLPLARVRDLLRNCRVVLGAMSVTLLTEWSSVASGANQPQWNWATWLQVGLLAAMTALTAGAVIAVYRVPALPRPAPAAASTGPDWLTDVFAVAARYGDRLGPLRRPVLGALSWTESHLAAKVRRHPLWSAAFASVVFGVAVGGFQATREGYLAPATLLVITLLGCGMFAFLAGAGSYIGLVRSGAEVGGGRRRALDAGVLACVGVLVVFAFRNSLWWIVGSRAAVARIPQAYALIGLAAAALFAVVFAVESLSNTHGRTQA